MKTWVIFQIAWEILMKLWYKKIRMGFFFMVGEGQLFSEKKWPKKEKRVILNLKKKHLFLSNFDWIYFKMLLIKKKLFFSSYKGQNNPQKQFFFLFLVEFWWALSLRIPCKISNNLLKKISWSDLKAKSYSFSTKRSQISQLKLPI